MEKRITVAIDGPSGAGKSTLARRLAVRLGFLYIDTGAMYRAIALWAIRLNIALSDMHRLEQLAEQADLEFIAGSSALTLNGEDISAHIRTPEIADAASKVSQVPGVRRALVERQRQIGSRASLVMEGRDIGSIVFPEAAVKIFLDADPAERAARRARELDIPPADVSADLHQRDHRDRTRAEAPLVQAPDAIYVDTTGMTLDEAEEALLKLVRDRTTNGKERTH